LDKSVQIEIGGCPGKLLLPRLEWPADADPLLVAPGLPPETIRHITHWSKHGDDEYVGDMWGRITSWHPAKRQINAVYVSRVVMRFSAMDEELTYSDYLYGRGHPQSEGLARMFNAVDGWFDALRTWIEVKRDQDLDSSHPLQGVQVTGGGLHIMSDDQGNLSLPASANQATVVLHSDESITLPLLRAAAKQVTNSVTPSEAYLLLRDSRAALRRNQLRRAAIDVGSALEVVLADFNRAVTHVTFARLPTLGTWVNNSTIAARASLPAGLQQDVVDVRNAAIHQNLTPPRADVAKAIQIVSSILERLAPLPI
jgi:hypothetical protein